jgi:hypothetical protein
VTDKQLLKLVVAYDRNRNEYSIAAHNRTSEEAEAHVAHSWCWLRPGSTGPKSLRSAAPAAKP